ncbi:hypothetical protein BJV78DRAFT_1286154 [Lactifluus subvellereus]|nr:hypothetical protein BJV78DRAFT_1286154 [Lactifluus subvellereus]
MLILDPVAQHPTWEWKCTPPTPSASSHPLVLIVILKQFGQVLNTFVSEEELQPSQWLQHQQVKTGLGRKKVPDTIVTQRHRVRSHQPKFPKPFKRDLGVIDVSNKPPFKRWCLTFIDEDDLSWLKGDIGGIKERLQEVAAQAREDRQETKSMLEELLCGVRQWSWACI